MTLASPILSYLLIRRNNERRLISAEMCFIRRTVGYTLSDHKRNEIMKELHTP
jgi:hypothetical protein